MNLWRKINNVKCLTVEEEFIHMCFKRMLLNIKQIYHLDSTGYI